MYTKNKTCLARTLTYASAFTMSVLLAQASQAQDSNTTVINENRNESKISAGGVFIEPILSAIREDSKIKTSQLSLGASDTSGTAEGYGLGLRLGVHASEIVFLGVDGRFSRESLKDSFYESADADVYNWGPTLGVQTPLFGLRLMGTYILGGEFNPASGAQGLDLKFKDARGWRVGLGLHVSIVSVNLEYQDLTYDNTQIESFGRVNSSGESKVDSTTQGYSLSLSFPVEL